MIERSDVNIVEATSIGAAGVAAGGVAIVAGAPVAAAAAAVVVTAASAKYTIDLMEEGGEQIVDYFDLGKTVNKENASKHGDKFFADSSEIKVVGTDLKRNRTASATEISKDIYANNLKIEDQFNRVSLNICPMTYRNDNTYVPKDIINKERLPYILGSDDKNGLLRKYFSSTYGIIFPYTPKISMTYSADYESSTILHSNLSINMYKNTTPSEITLSAEFTADNEENAEYMYAVMIFLKAMTKTDFGVNAKKRGAAGMPPPVLYLNGWGNAYINIPVVIKSFTIDYDKNKQYVYLPNYKVWLPTDITLQISLPIQPNLEKYKDQFDLDAYKNNTLNDKGNVDLKTYIEKIEGVQYYSKIYHNVETRYWETDESGNMPIYIVKNYDKVVKAGTSDYYELSQYKKEKQYSGHGWTW